MIIRAPPRVGHVNIVPGDDVDDSRVVEDSTFLSRLLVSMTH